MEEALEVEPGALMIWSVIVEVVRSKGGRVKEELWSRVFINRPLLPPHLVLSDRAEHTVAPWGSAGFGDAMPP